MTSMAIPDTPSNAATTVPPRAPDHLPPPNVEPDCWAAAELTSARPAVRDDLRRLLTGLSLTGGLGMASGLVHDAAQLPANTFATMWIPLSVLLFAVPGLFILLSLFDAPVSPRDMLHWAARATFALGLSYAGLAPLVALYGLTGSDDATLLVSFMVFALGGLHGLSQLLGALSASLAPMPPMARLRCRLTTAGFTVFALALAARAFLSLPVVGGLS